MGQERLRHLRLIYAILLAAGCLFAAACQPEAGQRQQPTSQAEQPPPTATPQPEEIGLRHVREMRRLRVCADPNNLPFSNERREGFENRIAELLAGELNATVEYTWWAQRRGFIRETLRAERCDLVIGLPASFELALTTRPYYRSTYVFVSRRDRGLRISSFDDPVLRDIRIGVHFIGDDYANPPPAHALARRNIVQNTVGYSIYGDYAEENPPARIIAAVARREVDVAIVWGPLAGYYAARQPAPLELAPVSPSIDLPFLPMVYDISLGVRRGEEEFKTTLEEILERRHDAIQAILREYGVPQVAG